MKSIKLLIKFAILALVCVSILSKVTGRSKRLKRGNKDYSHECTPRLIGSECKDGLTCDKEEKACYVSNNKVCGKGRAERNCAGAGYHCLPTVMFPKKGEEPNWICKYNKDVISG